MDSIVKKFIGKGSISIVEAMQRIDLNARGILILVDGESKLIGTLSDGDIRRFLLSGGKLESACSEAANIHPRAASTIEEAEKLYHQRNYVAIPILDENKIVIDVYIGKKIEKYVNLNLPVVINAGGKGTRLDPFTRVLPKPLIPVGDLPIIEHIMNLFSNYGCTEFHVIVNYKKQLMKAYFAENENKFNITWYDEEKPLGTGGGLSLLKGKLDRTFFFTSCDTLIQTAYDALVKFHRDSHNLVTMVCAHKNLTIPYGVIEMGKQGKIDGFKEKPLMSFLTNTGLYLVEPDVLNSLEDGKAVGFPDVIEKLRHENKNIAVFPVSESNWMDMGQLSELEKMRARLYGE